MPRSFQRLAAFLVATLIVACCAATAFAGDNANRALFGNRAVQRDLHLSEEQQAKVDALVAEGEDQIAEQLKKATAAADAGGSGAELEAKIADEVMAKQGQRFMALLDKQQQVRFWQIGIQAYGKDRAFENNRVQRLLQLSDQQQADIAKALDATRTEIVKLATNVDLDIETVKKRVDAARKACLDSELKVLTDKQQKDFDAILGKPFDLDLLRTTEGVKPRALTFIFPMRGGCAYFLLGSEENRQKLGLSREQTDEVKRILDHADHDLTTVRLSELKKNEKDFPELSREEQRRTVRAILTDAAVFHQEAMRQVAKLLSPEQAAKFDALAMRVLGPRAIEADSVAGRLKITNEQKAALAKLTTDFDDATAPFTVVRRQSDLDKQYDEELKRLISAMQAVLTDEQKKLLNDGSDQ